MRKARPSKGSTWACQMWSSSTLEPPAPPTVVSSRAAVACWVLLRLPRGFPSLALAPTMLWGAFAGKASITEPTSPRGEHDCDPDGFEVGSAGAGAGGQTTQGARHPLRDARNVGASHARAGGRV